MRKVAPEQEEEKEEVSPIDAIITALKENDEYKNTIFTKTFARVLFDGKIERADYEDLKYGVSIKVAGIEEKSTLITQEILYWISAFKRTKKNKVITDISITIEADRKNKTTINATIEFHLSESIYGKKKITIKNTIDHTQTEKDAPVLITQEIDTAKEEIDTAKEQVEQVKKFVADYKESVVKLDGKLPEALLDALYGYVCALKQIEEIERGGRGSVGDKDYHTNRQSTITKNKQAYRKITKNMRIIYGLIVCAIGYGDSGQYVFELHFEESPENKTYIKIFDECEVLDADMEYAQAKILGKIKPHLFDTEELSLHTPQVSPLIEHKKLLYLVMKDLELNEDNESNTIANWLKLDASIKYPLLTLWLSQLNYDLLQGYATKMYCEGSAAPEGNVNNLEVSFEGGKPTVKFYDLADCCSTYDEDSVDIIIRAILFRETALLYDARDIMDRDLGKGAAAGETGETGETKHDDRATSPMSVDQFPDSGEERTFVVPALPEEIKIISDAATTINKAATIIEKDGSDKTDTMMKVLKNYINVTNRIIYLASLELETQDETEPTQATAEPIAIFKPVADIGQINFTPVAAEAIKNLQP